MKSYRKSVFVVVYVKHNGKILYLMLKRRKHWRGWEFVKGGVEKNEKEIDSARREVFEETGHKPLRMKKFNFFGKYRYKRVLPDRKNIIGQSYRLFSSEIKFGKVSIDKLEHLRYSWLDYDKAYKLLTHKNQKKCLKIVNSSLKNGL